MAAAPARTICPGFREYLGWVREEVEGPTDAQLDWEDPSQEWAQWSIRRQVSHVALACLFWMVRQWGKELFPKNPPPPPVDFSKAAVYDRRLDEERYWRMEDILGKLEEAVAFIEGVIARETAESVRAKTLTKRFPPELPMGKTEEKVYEFWLKVAPFHEDGGVRHEEGDPHLWHFTLLGTLRHLYWEGLVHLNTVQRLKRAQGLPPRVRLPEVGYLTSPLFKG